MNSRMLFYYKIIIIGIILVLTGFVGYLLFVEPNTETNDNNDADVDITIGQACTIPIPNGVICQEAAISGITPCVVAPENPVFDPYVLYCCPAGQIVINEGGVNKCVSTPRNVPEGGACTPYDNVIECTSGICCDCGVCGGVSQTCTDLCSPDPVDPTPINPTPTDPTPTDPTPTNPTPTNPTPTDPVVPTDPGTDDGTDGGDNTDTDDNSNGGTDGIDQDENVSDGLDNLPDTAINLEKDHYFLLYGFVLIFYGLTVRMLINRIRE